MIDNQSPRLSISASEVHLWVVDVDAIVKRELLTQYRATLSHEETERMQRFRFEKHQHQFLISHALVRCVLSRYADRQPHEWTFTQNGYGRPEVAASPDIPGLTFNLSHTDGKAVVAVTRDQAVGVDVEPVERKNVSLDIAKRFFSPSEFLDLCRQPKEKQKQRFLDYWTLKESFIKAKGMGLSYPLDGFSLHFSADSSIKISFSSSQQDDPDTWKFWLLHSDPKYTVAICVDTNSGTIHQKLTVWHTVPFEKEKVVATSAPGKCRLLIH